MFEVVAQSGDDDMTLEEIEAAAELMHDTFGHLDENGFHDMLAYAKAMMDNRHERRRAMAMKPRLR